MPIYEFGCCECGVEFEKLVLKAGDITDVKCPACGSPKLEEKISGFASFSKGGSSETAACAPGGG